MQGPAGLRRFDSGVCGEQIVQCRPLRAAGVVCRQCGGHERSHLVQSVAGWVQSVAGWVHGVAGWAWRGGMSKRTTPPCSAACLRKNCAVWQFLRTPSPRRAIRPTCNCHKARGWEWDGVRQKAGIRGGAGGAEWGGQG